MSAEWKRATWVHDMTAQGGLGHTTATLMDAFESFLTQVGWSRTSWMAAPTTDRYFTRTAKNVETTWRYNGDGPTQHAGIHVKLNTASTRLEITVFLENTAGTGAQRETTSGQTIYVTYSAAAPTTFLFVGGEDGWYVEAGRDGTENNAGHFFIATVQPFAEFGNVRPEAISWTCPGFPFDLVGSLRFPETRASQYVTATDGSGHTHSTSLLAYSVRGSNSIKTAAPANDQTYYVGSLDTILMRAADTAQNQTRYNWGLPFNAFDDAHRISPMAVSMNGADSATYNVPNGAWVVDGRGYRKIRRFTVISWTALAFSYLLDTQTGINYRVGYVPDAGRSVNIGVPWPDNSNVITIPL
jgi:hypothetical protein